MSDPATVEAEIAAYVARPAGRVDELIALPRSAIVKILKRELQDRIAGRAA